ncbi:unnamed protein product, partial [Mesorhabditis belari]|uniref:Uncharacterized protein n=1 Tax=Mesorhabditis belari TaxID=2138241 RepID=A0AAF3F9Y6_9BILA
MRALAKQAAYDIFNTKSQIDAQDLDALNLFIEYSRMNDKVIGQSVVQVHKMDQAEEKIGEIKALLEANYNVEKAKNKEIDGFLLLLEESLLKSGWKFILIK